MAKKKIKFPVFFTARFADAIRRCDNAKSPAWFIDRSGAVRGCTDQTYARFMADKERKQITLARAAKIVNGRAHALAKTEGNFTEGRLA